MHRFQLLEQMVKADNRQLTDMTLAEMDVYWEKAKGMVNEEIKINNA